MKAKPTDSVINWKTLEFFKLCVFDKRSPTYLQSVEDLLNITRIDSAASAIIRELLK